MLPTDNEELLEKFQKDFNIEEMFAKGRTAASFLKAMAHEGRLMILCHLVTGERSVTELENLLSLTPSRRKPTTGAVATGRYR